MSGLHQCTLQGAGGSWHDYLDFCTQDEEKVCGSHVKEGKGLQASLSVPEKGVKE